MSHAGPPGPSRSHGISLAVRVRHPARGAFFTLAGWLLAGSVAAGEAAPPTDVLLESYLQDALHSRPELTQAAAEVRADSERVPQAGALADPVLTLGLQNDSFTRYSIGQMETSWYTVMVSQAFPGPQKRGLREEVARAQPALATAALERSLLSVQAEVRRAYVDLLLVRDQLKLLGKLGALWEKSEKLAKARYSVGEAPQSDLLRAQLQLTRLRLQRLGLNAKEHVQAAALNRARGHPVDEPVVTTAGLEHLQAPPRLTSADAEADAEARSPELRQARLGEAQSKSRLALARADRWPDYSVAAGVMPRGRLEPMWQLLVGFSLPVYAGSKQQRAVAEAGSRNEATSFGEQAVLQQLRLRTAQRSAVLDSLERTNTLYREALLVQSEVTAASTLAQYEAGKVPFASALEALGGFLGDEGAYLESMAQALRVSIAQVELSLEEPALLTAAARGEDSPAPSGSGGM